MKIRKIVVRDLAALLGMIIVLGTAVVLDNWLAAWRLEASANLVKIFRLFTP